MTSTQAQKETKMNEITNTRNAIKGAKFSRDRGVMHTASIAVTTFADQNGRSQKIVSGRVRQPIGSIYFNNGVRENYVSQCVSFHEDKDKDVETTVSTTSSSIFEICHASETETMAVTLTRGASTFEDSEFNLYLSPKTARKMAEAILAQLDADQA